MLWDPLRLQCSSNRSKSTLERTLYLAAHNGPLATSYVLVTGLVPVWLVAAAPQGRNTCNPTTPSHSRPARRGTRSLAARGRRARGTCESNTTKQDAKAGADGRTHLGNIGAGHPHAELCPFYTAYFAFGSAVSVVNTEVLIRACFAYSEHPLARNGSRSNTWGEFCFGKCS